MKKLLPAEILNKCIEAARLAQDNFLNQDLYDVLMYRVAELKMMHAKTQGVAAIKIIQEKYGHWLCNDLASKYLRLCILNKFAIDVDVVISSFGATIEIKNVTSANTLFKAFKRHKPLLKMNEKTQTMFIENLHSEEHLDYLLQ